MQVKLEPEEGNAWAEVASSRGNSYERKMRETAATAHGDSNKQIESLNLSLKQKEKEIRNLLAKVEESRIGQLIHPLENKIIVNMSL